MAIGEYMIWPSSKKPVAPFTLESVEDYLARGGKITKIPRGVSGEKELDTMRQYGKRGKAAQLAMRGGK